MPKNTREKERSRSYNARAAARAIEEQQSVRSRSLSPAGTEKNGEGKLICDTKTSTPSKNPTSPDEKDHEIDISPIKPVGRDSGFTGYNETSLEMSSDNEEDDVVYYEGNEEFDCNAGVDNPLPSEQEEESEGLKAFRQEMMSEINRTYHAMSSDQDSGCEKSTENPNSKGSNEVLNKSFKGTSNSGRGGIPKSSFGASHSQEESPETIYQKLSKVRFSNDRSSNPQVWAGNEQISSYVNQAIGSKGISQGLAYYIAPTLSGFDSEERIEDVAELLCKRKEKNGEHSNLYGEQLDKPCIAIANTSTVHSESSTDYNKEGGAHWVGWVLLPKKYSTLSGKEISNNKYKVYFFDSLKAGRSFPEKLKQYLIKGGDISKSEKCTLSLFPFCKEEEIEVVDISHLTGQQQGMNGSDCGWWAVYYVLMTVYTGGVEFLEPLEGKNLSAAPLREIMNLQESYRSPSQSTEDTPLVEMVTPNTKSTDKENASPQRSSPSSISKIPKNPKNHSLSERIHGQQRPSDGSGEVMRRVFRCVEFNSKDLGDDENPLKKKFNAIIKDLEENKSTNQGDIKLIRGKGGIKYFRAKLSNRDRLLFKAMRYGDKDVFVILEVVLNHDYRKLKFLTDETKIESIKIIDQDNKEVSDNAGTEGIEDAPQVCWLGKFITLSATQEDIVENAEGKYNLPLVVSGSAGSGKTSVALEKLRKVEEEFKEGKILYITKSENLIKKSKELYEYAYYDEVAKEEKTGVPEQIEFLSVHEFIERVTKEDAKMKKRVEGKRPINRNAFFSWFNEKCKKDKFRKYTKDGGKIFEEFIAVIGGRGLLGEDGKDRYAELGDRQSIFPKEKRANICSFFEEYKKFIEESSEYYDTSLIAHECVEKVQANYDAVVVDEVQDLTKSTLKLILKSLKDENKSNFLLCGDVNQVIHPSFFSMSRLKHFFRASKGKELKFSILEKNYRNSKPVIELANRILHFKNYCFASEDKMTKDEKDAFFMKSDTKKLGNVGFIAKGDEQEIAGKISESTNWAVLVLDDESKEDACKCFDPSFVFNIHEAKGLEFDNVILYKFTSHKAYSDMWNIARQNKGKKEKVEDTINKIHDSYNNKDVNTSRPKNQGNNSFEEYKFYINALYVAATRTVSNAYIIEGEKQCNLLKVVAPGKEVNKVNTENITKEEFDPKKWKDMALTLIYNGNMEQAKGKVIKLLEKGEKEYVREIIGVLEAERYHREAQEISNKLQSFLGKDESGVMKSLSELKIDTENPSSQSPQKGSMDDTRPRTQTKKARKRRGKAEQNQNQENKSEKLQISKQLVDTIRKDAIDKFKNVDISRYDEQEVLSLALENSSFYIVNYLIEDKGFTLKNCGLQIANTRVKGATLLHLAVQNGLNALARSLLDYGVNVNAKDQRDLTPLHVAAEKGDENAVELLLQHKAQVDAKDQESFTPLHVAAQKGHKGVVELLLNKRANVNAENKGGFTPLHLAAQKGHEGVVKLLLNKGANVDAENKEDFTPLCFATNKGHEGVVKLLLQHGANARGDFVSRLDSVRRHGYKNASDYLLTCTNINTNCIDLRRINEEEEDKRKFVVRKVQDSRLFDKVKEAAEKVKGGGELGESLKKELEDLLKPESDYGFKPGLNYSKDNKNTTVGIAIEAGGELLQLLYDNAEKYIGVDTKIFKQLKHAKEQQENSQPKSDFDSVSISGQFLKLKI